MSTGGHTQRIITANVEAKNSETLGHTTTERVQVGMLSKLHVYVVQTGDINGLDVYFYGSATQDGEDIRPIPSLKDYGGNGRVYLTSAVPSIGFVISYDEIPSYISAKVVNITDTAATVKIIFDMWR